MLTVSIQTSRINSKKKNVKIPGGSTKLSVSNKQEKMFYGLSVAHIEQESQSDISVCLLTGCCFVGERRKLDIEYFSKLLEKIMEVQQNKKKLRKLVRSSPKSPKKRTKGTSSIFILH